MRLIQRAIVASAIFAGAAVSSAAGSSLSPTELAPLIAQCAPRVHPQTQAALVIDESGANPYALHDNNSGRAYLPSTYEDAWRIAWGLIERDRAVDGRGIDVGIAQINSHNFAAQGVSLAQMLTPCDNLRVSSRMLRKAYLAFGSVKAAAETYNSGSPTGDDGYFARLNAKAREDYVVAVVRASVTSGSRPMRRHSPSPSAHFYTEGNP